MEEGERELPAQGIEKRPTGDDESTAARELAAAEAITVVAMGNGVRSAAYRSLCLLTCFCCCWSVIWLVGGAVAAL